MKRSALVTGAAGFIGRHMDAALTAAGWRVNPVDTAYRSVARWDARDYFRESGEHYDLVVHAAAVVGGRAVIDGNPLALAVNLELDAAMFAWAARTRPGRVAYLSSSAVYPVHLQRAACETKLGLGTHGGGGGTTFTSGDFVPDPRVIRWDPKPLGEDDAGVWPGCEPDQLYGWCKLTGERLAALARAEGVPVTVVRPFSGYGEDQSTDYPFPAMAQRARERQDPFVIWGTGDQVRDWIHVDDICRAILLMADGGIDGPVNLGTGRGTSMRELAGMFAAVAGYEPEFKTLPEMPAGVAYRVADVTRLSEFCTPAVTLEEGVERAVRGRI